MNRDPLHPPTNTRAGAVIAVENRLDDLGLVGMARTLGRTPGDQLYRIRGYLLESRIAAASVHTSASHFNQKPIAAFALALSEAVTRALMLVDLEIANLVEANSRTQADHEAARKALKTPRQRMTEGDR